jgi:3-deoxy-D-manno-octulosonic-acid transferase
MQQSVYRWAAKAVHRVPLGRGKLARSLAGRRGAVERWIDWAGQHRTTAPLIWIHAASVGEALTAQPVVARLRSILRDVQVIHSYTSPSVEQWPAPFEAGAADYAPLDEPAPVARVLEALSPSLLVFSRGDLWPELVRAAQEQDVPVAVLGAGVRPRSRRRNPFLRPLYAAVHEPVSWLGAVSEADAARWVELGVAPDAIEVTGDPRHDEVLERVTHVRHLGSLLPWTESAPTIVAGSAEPADVPVLLEATRTVLAEHPSAKLLLVPHAIHGSFMKRLHARCRRSGLGVAAWPETDPERQASVVVVTARGLLYDLYALGDAAYVGGGFRSGRLHAAIEPAAYGLPVVVGPAWRGAADAASLVASGGAVPLPPRDAAGALARTWLRWLTDEQERQRAGLAARGALHEGAAVKTVCALLRLLGTVGGEAAADQRELGRVPCGAGHAHPPSVPSTARR